MQIQILSAVNLIVHNFQVITISFSKPLMTYSSNDLNLIIVQPKPPQSGVCKDEEEKIVNYTGSAPMSKVLDLISFVLRTR